CQEARRILKRAAPIHGSPVGEGVKVKRLQDTPRDVADEKSRFVPPRGYRPGATAETHTCTSLPAGAEKSLDAFDPNVRPIWEQIAEIGAKIPPEEWAKVPDSTALDSDVIAQPHANGHGATLKINEIK
ncbi:unnamed protein product, partial [marine sediment metagenome]